MWGIGRMEGFVLAVMVDVVAVVVEVEAECWGDGWKDWRLKAVDDDDDDDEAFLGCLATLA